MTDCHLEIFTDLRAYRNAMRPLPLFTFNTRCHETSVVTVDEYCGTGCDSRIYRIFLNCEARSFFLSFVIKVNLFRQVSWSRDEKVLQSAMLGFLTSCKTNFSLRRKIFFPRERKDFSSGGKNHHMRSTFSDPLMPVVDIVSNLYRGGPPKLSRILRQQAHIRSRGVLPCVRPPVETTCPKSPHILLNRCPFFGFLTSRRPKICAATDCAHKAKLMPSV